MSVERAEIEISVNTPLELAGAREGADELERAIGRAKVLGQEYRHLEKRLARARSALERFGHKHAGPVETSVAEGDTAPAPDRKEIEAEAGRLGQGDEGQGLPGQGDGGQAEDSAGEHTRGMRTDGANQTAENGSSGPSDESREGQSPEVTSQPEEGEATAEEGPEGSPAEASPAEPGVWNGPAAGRDIESIVRQMLEEWEAQGQPREWERQEEARMTALEEKMELRLSQFERWLMIGRGNNP
jgi:hypothetical protein